MVFSAGVRPVKRSLTLAGHRTSVSLEPVFWQVLERMAAGRGLRLSRLIAEIDAGRAASGGAQALASALRVAVVHHLLACSDDRTAEDESDGAPEPDA